MKDEKKFRQAIEIDQRIRKLVGEYYTLLNEMGDPARAVELLADHVAIMVEMINEFKRSR